MKTKLTILISLLSFACIGQSGGIKLSISDTMGMNNLWITPENYYKFGMDSRGNLMNKSKDTTFTPIPNYGLLYGQGSQGNFLNNDFYFYNQSVQQLVIKGDTVVIESPQLKFIQIDGTTYEIIRKSELREVKESVININNGRGVIIDTSFNIVARQFIMKAKVKNND